MNLLFSSFKGIHDDLEFLPEEDLSSTVNLCALHCELRNTEQLLSSLGLFFYKVGSLDECNAELANYGPENFSSRITLKMKRAKKLLLKSTTSRCLHFQVSSILFQFCHDCMLSFALSTLGLLLRVRTKHGPGVHGPPPWTGSMDHFHGPGPWTRSMNSFFEIMRNEQKQK